MILLYWPIACHPALAPLWHVRGVPDLPRPPDAPEGLCGVSAFTHPSPDVFNASAPRQPVAPQPTLSRRANRLARLFSWFRVDQLCRTETGPARHVHNCMPPFHSSTTRERAAIKSTSWPDPGDTRSPISQLTRQFTRGYAPSGIRHQITGCLAHISWRLIALNQFTAARRREFSGILESRPMSLGMCLLTCPSMNRIFVVPKCRSHPSFSLPLTMTFRRSTSKHCIVL